ncbi:MAG: hypothetical protein HKP01_03030 [Gemmatimonadetes bacterium]|nr:hypothetical protein [Gemmatimonadota bacterium]
MNRKCALFLLLYSAVVSLSACTEDSFFAENSQTAPGVSTPTVEMVFEAGELPSWRDTTYWGFVLPSSASFSLVSDREDLRSRPLGRFSTLPDSLFVDTVRVAVDSFASAAVRLSIDTLQTELPGEDVELTVWSLSRSFDADEATWQQAREGEAWATPGGDLGTLLGSNTFRFEADSLGLLPDSAVVPLVGNADSLLTAWRDSDGEPGIAVVLTGPGGTIRASRIALVAGAVPEGIDTVVSVVRGTTPGTFIYDPPTPSPTTRLRLAGLPAARYYLDFELPDSLGFIRLRGSTINRAAIEFRPTGAPAEPYPLRAAISAQAVRLLADPFVFGEKTPIGSTLGALELLSPDSLASGNTMQYDITSLVRLWSQAPFDSLPPLRVGIVPVPENRQFGFWEFFSREDGPGLRPVVRLLFTPNPSFLLP